VSLRPSDIDLTDPDLFLHGVPHDAFAMLRREAPVQWQFERGGRGFWSVTRHRDVVAANRDVEALSAGQLGIMMFDQPHLAEPDAPRMMIEMDPPRHTRYRLLVNKGFTPRMIGRLEEHMRAVTTRIVDRVVDAGHADFVVDVASELPLQVIAEMLGVPSEDRPLLFALSNRIMGFDDTEYGSPGGAPAEDAIAEMYSYASALGTAKRADLEAGAQPGDIVSALLTAEVNGERLSESEFDLFFLLLVVAGNETTRTAIAQGMLALLQQRDQWDMVCADPGVLSTGVDEILRWSTPILHFRRTAVRETEIGDQTIAADDKVVLWYVSANFDADVFDDPLRLDMERAPNEHVTFGGGGPHFCLGANLARLEIRVLFEELASRLPGIEMAGPVERLRSNWTNGIKRMPVRWTS